MVRLRRVFWRAVLGALAAAAGAGARGEDGGAVEERHHHHYHKHSSSHHDSTMALPVVGRPMRQAWDEPETSRLQSTSPPPRQAGRQRGRQTDRHRWTQEGLAGGEVRAPWAPPAVA